jgi:hypothetical protein
MPKAKPREQIIIALIIAAAIIIAAIASRHGNMNPDSYASPNTPVVLPAPPPQAYLGFDRNDYPGDAALLSLRHTFSYSSYWLNDPPGEKANSWAGKRAVLVRNDFGFLVLFTGRESKRLRAPANASALGTADAHDAAESARREGFPPGTVIFIDIEEGGRMLPGQRAYIFSWMDGVGAAGFRAGIYCSAIVVNDSGEQISTASDIRDHAQGRAIVFWVYNDACPPSPGCAYRAELPLPSASGFSDAAVWQFVQSPRRAELTARCASTYNADGNCYPPGGSAANSSHVDLDSATSADPSDGRR